MWVKNSEINVETRDDQSIIKDSPLLARVRRAMIRQDEDTMIRTPRQSILSPMFDKETVHAIKKGLLWHQRDRLFSRWKERYFILTRDYLHCFRRASGSERITEMGQFILKIKLIDIEKIEWENKKTYSSIVLNFGRDGKIFLRTTDGLEEWYEFLEECMLNSKERRKNLRCSLDGSSKTKDNNNISTSCNNEDWFTMTPRLKATDTVSTRQEDFNFLRKRDWKEEWDHTSLDNRLSLLTDIDINSYDDSTLEAPSVTSYRLNKDILCIQPASLRPSGSFKTKEQKQYDEKPCQFIKYRERSYSDIQRVDKRSLRTNFPGLRLK